jgi:hypothetical protein
MSVNPNIRENSFKLPNKCFKKEGRLHTGSQGRPSSSKVFKKKKGISSGRSSKRSTIVKRLHERMISPKSKGKENRFSSVYAGGGSRGGVG